MDVPPLLVEGFSDDSGEDDDVILMDIPPLLVEGFSDDEDSSKDDRIVATMLVDA